VKRSNVSVDEYMKGLTQRSPVPVVVESPVRSTDKTAKAEAPALVTTATPQAMQTSVSAPVVPLTPSDSVDTLFGQSKSYREFKKEKPEHRLMLWHRLNGLSVKEIALAMGYTPNAVREVCNQPWFREAFARLSTEIGKDVVTTYLEGEVQNSLETLVKLRDGAESEAVRLAATNSILDRIRGKPVAKTEMKVTGDHQHTIVHDAAKLLDEERRLAEQLRSRGIGIN